MCRNIKTLRAPIAVGVTDDDVRAAALQYVRTVGGFRLPGPHHADAFNQAVDTISAATRDLLARLEASPGPKASPGPGVSPEPEASPEPETSPEPAGGLVDPARSRRGPVRPRPARLPPVAGGISVEPGGLVTRWACGPQPRDRVP
jgi:hypothetical protein